MLCFYVYFTVDKYSWLVDGTAQAQVELFINEEHSFEEYTEVTDVLDTPGFLLTARVSSQLLYFLESAGVPGSVKEDSQPPSKRIFHNDPSGLRRAETGAGEESRKLCWKTSGESDHLPPTTNLTVSNSCEIFSKRNCFRATTVDRFSVIFFSRRLKGSASILKPSRTLFKNPQKAQRTSFSSSITLTMQRHRVSQNSRKEFR